LPLREGDEMKFEMKLKVENEKRKKRIE